MLRENICESLPNRLNLLISLEIQLALILFQHSSSLWDDTFLVNVVSADLSVPFVEVQGKAKSGEESWDNQICPCPSLMPIRLALIDLIGGARRGFTAMR